MISRNEYRGCVKANVLKEDWETALAQTKTLVQEQKEQNKVLTVCLYQHKNMLFLYMETLQDGICPQTLLAPLVPYMEQWPEENGLTPWAPMYHIYHHSIPGDVSEWVKERAANEKSISYSQLAKYPCLSFEQGDKSSFYLSEEILSTNEYSRTVKASDRATMLNLMVGLNGYTLCSGIICEELNGSDYLAIPFEGDEQNQNSDMEIGYITRKNSILSKVGNLYVSSLKKYLEQNTVSVE